MARLEGNSISREMDYHRGRMDELSWWIEGHALSQSNAAPEQPDLTADLLRRIHEEIVERLRELKAAGKETGRRLAEELKSGDVSTVEQRKAEFREINREFSDLEERRNTVFQSWQERMIEDGLIERLGSRKRFFWLEKSVVILTLVVLLVLGREMLWKPSQGELILLFAIDLACCSVFWVEFFLRRAAAEEKRWFFRHNWIDLLSAVPMPPPALVQALPWQMIRLGRILRLFRLLRVLRLARAMVLLWRGMERLGRVTDVPLMTKSLRWLVVIWAVGGMVLLFEDGARNSDSDPIRPEAAAQAITDPVASGQAGETLGTSSNPGGDPEKTINLGDWGDRLWWSATTVVTGGYADLHDPRRPVSRIFTAGLVLSGIIVVGVFTATLTSVYLGEESQAVRRGQEEVKEALKRLMETRA